MPLDTLPRPSAPAVPVRRIDDRDGNLALLEIADGDGRWIGPEVRHADAEQLAQTLLAATGPGADLPPIVHKLALAYLAARGVTVLA